MKKLIKYFNFYTILFFVFIIWMFFFDTHSWFLHSELNSKIKKLELQKKQLEQEREETKKVVEKFQDMDSLIYFARENFYYKKEGEKIFIIE